MEERIEERRGEDGTICHVSAFGFVDPIRFCFWSECGSLLLPVEIWIDLAALQH